MKEFMKQVTELKLGLSPIERNLLSVAYTKCFLHQRESWQIIYTFEKEEKSKNEDIDEVKLNNLKDYREVIEIELLHICEEFLVRNMSSSGKKQENMSRNMSSQQEFYFYTIK